MRRRHVIGGAGIAGVAGIGTFVYRAAPSFWKQYASEMNRPIGQPTLRRRLRVGDMAALDQRVALRYHIPAPPLTAAA
jgi:hypothetical protein